MNQRSRRWHRSAALLTATLVLGALAGMAHEAIGQFVLTGTPVSGGEMNVRNACFSLSSTIGEPVAGSTSAGIYNVTSGFLGAPAVLRDSIFNDGFEVCSL